MGQTKTVKITLNTTGTRHMSDLGTIAGATGLESAINIIWAANAALVAAVPADRLITGRVPPSEEMPYVRLEPDGGSETTAANRACTPPRRSSSTSGATASTSAGRSRP